MKKFFFIFFVSVSIHAQTQSEPLRYVAPFFSDEKKNFIQAYVNDQLVSSGIIGASYILVEGTEIKDKKSINLLGYPYLENRSLPLGNFSKLLTILACYKLRDESKLNFEQKVLEYLPSLKIGSYDKEQFFLVKHLIQSTTGLSLREDRFLHFAEGGVYQKSSELVKKLKGLDYNRAPDTWYEESHLNTVLLAEIISSVSGLPFQEFMQENIFTPLGLEFYYNTKKFRKEGTSIYHYFFSSRAKTNPEESVEAFLASNKIYGKIEDIGKFISLQLGELDKELFSHVTLREIWQSPVKAKFDETTSYGGGWFIKELASQQVVYSHFSGKGSCGSIFLYPKEKAGFGIFFPIEAEPACHELAEGIHSILQGIPPKNISVPARKTVTLFCFFLMIVSFSLLVVVSLKFDRFFSMLPQPIEEKKDSAKNFSISLVLFLVLFWFCFLFFPNSRLGLKYTSLPYSDALFGWLPDLFYSLIFLLFLALLYVVYFGFKFIRDSSGEI